MREHDWMYDGAVRDDLRDTLNVRFACRTCGTKRLVKIAAIELAELHDPSSDNIIALARSVFPDANECPMARHPEGGAVYVLPPPDIEQAD